MRVPLYQTRQARAIRRTFVAFAALLVFVVAGCGDICRQDCRDEYEDCLGSDPESEEFSEFGWEDNCLGNTVSSELEKRFCECTYDYRKCKKDCP